MLYTALRTLEAASLLLNLASFHASPFHAFLFEKGKEKEIHDSSDP